MIGATIVKNYLFPWFNAVNHALYAFIVFSAPGRSILEIFLT